MHLSKFEKLIIHLVIWLVGISMIIGLLYCIGFLILLLVHL